MQELEASKVAEQERSNALQLKLDQMETMMRTMQATLTQQTQRTLNPGMHVCSPNPSQQHSRPPEHIESDQALSDSPSSSLDQHESNIIPDNLTSPVKTTQTPEELETYKVLYDQIYSALIAKEENHTEDDLLDIAETAREETLRLQSPSMDSTSTLLEMQQQRDDQKPPYSRELGMLNVTEWMQTDDADDNDSDGETYNPNRRRDKRLNITSSNDTTESTIKCMVDSSSRSKKKLNATGGANPGSDD